MMSQNEFIMVSSNVTGSSVRQDYEGNVIVTLKNITVNHNYKKNNKMTIQFNNEESKFLIPDKKSLNMIYKIYVDNIDNDQINVVRKYCENNLSMC